MCLCMSLYVYVHVSEGATVAEGSTGSPETGDADSCELPNIGP